MSQRIAVYSPYATVSPHFETELELVQAHLTAGDSVDYIACTGELPCCDFNASRVPAQCQSCSGRRDHGLEMLDGPVRKIPFRLAGLSPPHWPAIRTSDELKGMRLENFDLGFAVLSTIISMVRDPEPDLERLQPFVQRFLDAAWMTWEHTRQYIAERSPQRVYVFNGRFAAMRAVLRACESAGTPCVVHERGCDQNHFELYEGHLPHDIARMAQRMREHWEQAPCPVEREVAAAAWYEGRRNRAGRDWISFTRGQEPGRLPSGFEAGKPNLTFFSSSEDEFAAISDEWHQGIYPAQIDGIAALCRELASLRPDLKIWLRMHPNQGGADNQSVREMRRLDLPNLVVLPPESPVDSYALMDASSRVATFGSSTGIEAVWWGRPSVLLGPCYYQDFAGPWRARSHAQAVELLASNLAPGPRQDAAIYGYWFGSHGRRFRHFEADGFFHGRFRGAVLHARPVRKTLLEKIAREARRLFRLGTNTRPTTIQPDPDPVQSRD